MKINRPIRIASIGLGYGASVHVPAILELKNIEFLGLVGQDNAKTLKHIQNLGLDSSLVNSSVEEVLEKKPDIMTLALPPGQNEEVCKKILKSGCAILAEKPLAQDMDTAKRIINDAKGVPTAVGFQFVELPVFQKLSEILNEGFIGNVRHVSVNWFMESYVQKNLLWSWKSDARIGGGVMALFGSHLLYLAEYFFGPITKIRASFSNKATQKFAPNALWAAEDLVHIWLEHESGTIFSANFGNACPNVHHHKWQIVGKNDSLIIENDSTDYMRGFKIKGLGEHSSIQWNENQILQSGDGRIPPFKSLLQRFITSINSDEKETVFFPNFLSAIRVQYLMETVKKSAVEGQEVQVTSEFYSNNSL
jgi:predicted dehydrogenase